MLRNKLFGVALAGLVLFFAVKVAFAAPVSVANSKHNLSAATTNSVRATTVTQVCVFCHTPHGASGNAAEPALWNRTTTTATYTLYSSTYLTQMGYTTPVQPAQGSKVCLSCHDGTIALGSLRNVAGSGGAGNVTMTMTLAGRTSLLGTNLADDHPVGYNYAPTTLGSELNSWPLGNANVKLYPNNQATDTVECPTCHNAHDNQYTKFLRTSNTAGAQICTTCHNKTGYSLSGHALSTQLYKPNALDPVTTVGGYGCVNCHAPHGGLSQPLLRYNEQDTCYNEGCHGNNNPYGTNATARAFPRQLDIEADIVRASAHPTNTISGKHIDFFTGESPTDLGLGNVANRHAECYDCHNPHQVLPSVNKFGRWDGTLNKPLRISAALTGTWGVEPTWNTPPNTLAAMPNNKVYFAAAPTVFTKVSGATLTDEYQLCMKCHSGYVTLTGRDIASEINPQYSSYHGIVPPIGGTPGQIGGRPNGITNYFVNQTTMVQPWAGWGINGTQAAPGVNLTFVTGTAAGSTEYLRVQALTFVNTSGATGSVANYVRGRVWCSDCHGSNASTAPPAAAAKAAPYGPHGSAVSAMLPATLAANASNGDKMLIRSIASGAADGTPLCLACHLAASYTGGNTGSRQSRHGADTAIGRAPEGCFSCHMWESATTVPGGNALIYPHGMNKRWTSIGLTGTGTGQMVDAFVGGYYQNIDYTAKQCWVLAGGCNGEVGSNW